MKSIIFISLSFLALCSISSCGVKVQEDDAKMLMTEIFKARKQGSIAIELKYYAKEDFKIVPYDDVVATLYTVVGSAGRLKKVEFLTAKKQKRNQIGKGLTQYLVLSYEVDYSNVTLIESYYFYGDSETPKLVYMTLQF